MYEVKRVKSEKMFQIVKEILEQGGKAWITVTGMSMYPFLREFKDSVELAGCSFKTIKRGDIVLIKRRSGEYILHRVLRKESNSFFIIGDAQQWIEGPLDPDQLIAVVSTVKSRKNTISSQNRLWRILSELWLRMIPVRYKVLGVLRKVTPVYVKIKKVRTP